MPTNPDRVKEIFLQAAEQPDGAARAAYLDLACGGDAGLRDRVETLLRSHDPAGSFLASPAVKAPECHELATLAIDGVTTQANEDEDDDDFQFLEPSTGPGSVGRIGHFDLLEILGRGGFGIVFRAFDETLHRIVAIKMLSARIAATSPARKRFLREARSSAKIRHENIVQVYAVEDQPLPYLVMEFIPGETLQQRLDRTGPLETSEVLQLGRQLAEGLAAAHGTGLIHRDIKPGNILIEAGPNPHVKITDFGLARAADDASMTQSGVIAGTPMYMAPEQAHGDALDHRADLFSLGSVLYTMCTGRPPFRAKSTLGVLKRVAEDTPRPIREIIPEVPQWLCDLITQLQAKNPDDRIGTAQEVADRLGRGLEAIRSQGMAPSLPESSVAAGRVTLWEGEAAVESAPIPKPASADGPRLRPRRLAAAAAVLLLVLGGMGITEATGVTDVRGTVIRLFSPEGTLVVEVGDPEVSVKVDGSDVVITGAGAKEIRLKPGRYLVEARKDGKVVRRELVHVTRDGRPVVRITHEPSPDAKVAGSIDNESAWERSIAAMPANEQVQAVAARLKERNPGFDGAVTPTIEHGVVTGLKLLTDHVTELSPVRVLTKLRSLECTGSGAGQGRLRDLKPLRGLHLTSLSCHANGPIFDLSPLNGMPLVKLDCSYTLVSDLSPLKGMRLTYLRLEGTSVSDLSPLEGMRLRELQAQNCPASDLTPLQGMPLTSLDLAFMNRVTDLSPLKGMSLEYLNISKFPVSDLSILKGMTSLQYLALTEMKSLSDLTPLAGLPLRHLCIDGSGVSDLSPLKGMPLSLIRLTPRDITQGLDLIRDMEGLRTIALDEGTNLRLPAAEFWARYDRGEFK